ncbi:uncharacterized protein TNIN_345181 [Trichonephila inaurata madagascariensis]|uniref:Uncharacterized protein n=1 Tax=Trichonephila inaurata madagascariensis TaxID=2747483 RepID=A0A8X6YRL8_9ARAC|nr:uncharacterized protein TNIN_345181 [Trichonephila inaurata madagascariensis]
MFARCRFYCIGLRVRIFTLVIKLLLCLLYVIRVFLDRGPEHAACYGCDPVNVTMFMTPEQDISYNDMRPRTDYINWGLGEKGVSQVHVARNFGAMPSTVDILWED